MEKRCLYCEKHPAARPFCRFNAEARRLREEARALTLRAEQLERRSGVSRRATVQPTPQPKETT